MRCHGRMTGSDEPRGPLLPGVHRVIRTLDADEGPYRGTLVTDRGSVAVMTDAEAISGWGGWAHAGDEHVAGPLDLVRRHDGHDVLLPWCTERLSVFLGRRQADGPTLAAGEVSTLVGSLLRGLDELGEGEGAYDGDWWLTEDGRPMFVLGAGGGARERSALIVDRVHRDCADRALSRLLAGIRDGLRAGGARPGVPRRQLELWEAELFAIAAPRPLGRDTHAPARVQDIEMVRALRAAPTETRRTRSEGESELRDAVRGGLGGVLVAIARPLRVAGRLGVERWSALRASWTRDTMSDHRDQLAAGDRGSVRGREGAVGAPSRRVRRLVVAGAAAAVVLGAGMLWPGGATGESGQDDAAASPAAERETDLTRDEGMGASEVQGPDGETPRPTPTPDHAADDLVDPVAAAGALLTAIRRCAAVGDVVCEDAVAHGSGGIVDLLGADGNGEAEGEGDGEAEGEGDGEAEGDAEAGTVGEAGGGTGPAFSLVDQYGDVAVIRASTPSVYEGGAGTDRMLVLVRVAEKWLVRDAYDVADQPG